MTTVHDLPLLLDTLETLYDEACVNLREALGAYVRSGERPDPKARAAGLFAYPEIRIVHAPDGPPPRVAPGSARRAPTPSPSPGRPCSAMIWPNSWICWSPTMG